MLLLAPTYETSLAHSLVKAFAHLGHDVVLVEWPPPMPRLAAAAAHRLRFAALLAGRRLYAELLSTDGPFDFVLVMKGSYIQSSHIRFLRDTYSCPVLCWNADNPFDKALSNSGAGIPSAIRHYDIYVTWTDVIARTLQRHGAHPLVVPFGWDNYTFYPDAQSTNLVNEVRGRATFVGTWTRERETWLMSISDFEPIVFGNGWPKNGRLDIRPSVSGSSLRSIFTCSGVSLNFLRPQNKESHNMRTFEILGCGGWEVATRSPEHEIYATRYPSLSLFSSLAELRDLLEIGRQTESPALCQGLERETYTARVQHLINAVDSL